MSIEIKKFSGVMDTDSGNDFISPSSHKYARNVRFFGTPEGLRCQNIMGNTLLVNPFLPNTGTNETIGAYEDVQKQRIFIYNWNSLGLDAIYVYNINAGTFQVVIQVGTNPATNILNFDLNQPIVNVNIIYGDSQQGDILYWLNSQKQPVKINIDRALGNITPSYGTWQRSFLDVIKAPPTFQPVVAYQDDNTVTVNNLNGNLFKFKIRYYYNDNDKSVTSSQSVMPLPQGQLDPELASDPTQNSVIKIVMPTGAANVYQIEILGAISLGNVFGDYFSIQIVKKSDLSIPDNDLYTYSFYNNQLYAPIDINESNQLFDYVPQSSNAQEVLLTNILIYGASTENYNSVKPVIELTSDNNSGINITSFAIIAVQNGDTGLGTGNMHFEIVGKAAIPTSGNNVRVSIFIATSGGAINYSDTYTSVIPTTTSIITGLASAAASAGFTIVSSDSNNLVVSKTNAVLDNFYIINTTSGSNQITQSVPTFDYDDGGAWGLVHFDANGRSSGVMTTNLIVTTTIPYDSDVDQPEIILQITSVPPIEAIYYQLVRIPNVTKSKLEEWITDRAIPGIDPITNIAYIYLSIANLFQYITDNPSTATQLGYTWTVGDRVKILENTQTPTVFTTLNDFNIINSFPDGLIINGVTYTGEFLQILPPASGSEIVIDGTAPNQNFLIEIYTPSKTISQNANIYYEFGQRYLIGNPGTPSRFYQGAQTNQVTGTTPNQISITDGGYYMRYRTIYANNRITFTPTISQFVVGDANNNFMLAETFAETFSSLDYTPQSTSGGGAFGLVWSNAWWWLTVLTNGFQFLINVVDLTFQVVVIATTDVTFSIAEVRPDNTVTLLYTNTYHSVIVGQKIAVNISNLAYTCSASESRLFFYVTYPTGGGTLTMNVLGGSVFLTIPNSTFTVKVIDQNFSDFYPSSVNNNGRAWAIQPNIEQTFTGTLVRYSEAYNIGTNINNINRFYATNYDQYDQGRGDIQRFKVRNRNMRVFQVRGVGNVPIFQNVLTNTAGADNIGQSEKVINNIQYYEGEMGMGYQYTGLISGKIQDYFLDPVRGYWVRVSQDGLIPVSELYYGQYFIKNLITPYNDLTYTRADGAIARVFGYFDYFDEKCIFILQGGENSIEQTIPSYALSFNEKRNAFESFYDFANAEFALCAEQITYTFLNGNMYIHNNTTNYCQFFGQNFDAVIQVVFNKDLLEKKSWMSINELANDIFECPEIYTDSYSFGTTVQQSKLVPQNFRLLENEWSAAILRDLNSAKGLINGDSMKGSYLCATFQKTNAQKLVYLSLISVRFVDSPLTAK